jgi:hypothetical protein
MKFKKATDELLVSVTLEDLAEALGASVQAVRQARAGEGSSAHRSPPPGWEEAVRRLAERQAKRHKRLADSVSGRG